MKAVINFFGDTSVGIFPFTYEVNDLREPEDDDDRQFIRDTLQKCFADIEDEPCDVVFDDECPDCLQTGPCLNGCPTEIASRDDPYTRP